MATPDPPPASDERIMAALGHICILIPYIGVLVPIVIWITQKEKPRFVAGQALQAIAYQLFLLVAFFTGWSCYVFSFVIPILAIRSETAAMSEWPVAAVFSLPLAIVGMLPVSFWESLLPYKPFAARISTIPFLAGGSEVRC